MGINPDTELQLLEEEFPESFEALATKAPQALTDKLLSVARSTALQMAAGREIADMSLPRYRPPMRMKDATLRPPNFMMARRSPKRPPPLSESRLTSASCHKSTKKCWSNNLSEIGRNPKRKRSVLLV